MGEIFDVMGMTTSCANIYIFCSFSKPSEDSWDMMGTLGTP
jgi:hypothetical protein